ncbi:hypothetical protein [Chryseobacterium potabilaquae]|uniref:Uncharacterized protein n=1 Tax=Chryseobacterium potabilaquae TaxID=2675057 RepID=A0A6N4XC50_9FLAO|nr:hypothetical protein [Chryseobacterium potabilaquae]CAA7197319.1 hypothetical protein CHRY9293_03374 [Chryseobacterium potabilaquae]
MQNQTKKISLDAFKEMAEKVQTEEVMQKVEGGDQSDCHGFWGQAHKVAVKIGEVIIKTNPYGL